MMHQKVIVRVDGNTHIGLGHLTRSIALGQMLKDNFDVKFVSKEIPEAIAKEIQKLGFQQYKIEDEEEFFNLLKSDEIVVLDNYFFNSIYQKRIKDIGCILVCIDDIYNRKFYADLIINHAPGITSDNYETYNFTQFALGLDYALLRPVFLEAARSIDKKKGYEKAFLCFGGSDSKKLTEKCLKILIEECSFKKIYVVLGAANQDFEQIQKIANANQNIALYQAIEAEEILNLMKASDLAIVPASGILLEVLCAGCKVISGMYAENQKFIYGNYKKQNIIIDAKNFEIEALKKALKQSSKTEQNKPNVIDGLSGKRIERIFLHLGLSIRKVKEKDCKVLFDWANDQSVRRNAFNENKIEWEDHKTWFFTKIKSSETEIFILEKRNCPIGQIRYDKEDNYWKVDYSIAQEFRGFGFGKSILDLSLKQMDGEIKAWVKKENFASCKVFEDLGFKRNKAQDQVIEYSTWM